MDETIFQAIEQVGRDKDIDVDLVIKAAEEAIAAAARKYYRTGEDFFACFDKDAGRIKLCKKKMSNNEGSRRKTKMLEFL